MLNIVFTSACLPLSTVTQFIASHLLSLRYNLGLSSHLHLREIEVVSYLNIFMIPLSHSCFLFVSSEVP